MIIVHSFSSSRMSPGIFVCFFLCCSLCTPSTQSCKPVFTCPLPLPSRQCWASGLALLLEAVVYVETRGLFNVAPVGQGAWVPAPGLSPTVTGRSYPHLRFHVSPSGQCPALCGCRWACYLLQSRVADRGPQHVHS